MAAPLFKKEEEKEESLFEIDFTPSLPKLPELKERNKINIRYPLIKPFAYAHLFWNDQTNELVYFVEEPVLDEREKEVLRLVKLALEEMINISFIRAKKLNIVMKYLERSIQAILIELGVKISLDTYRKIMYYIYRDAVGLNEIEPLLNDYYIEDIECNGVGFPLYIVHRKYENMRTNIIFENNPELVSFVEKLAQKSGRYVSYANPMLDGTLPDGSRVNATYTDDVTTRGPTFTIRKFTKDPWTPIHLMDHGTATAAVFAYFWIAIEYKFNMMVIGETASGKTTLLNSLMNFIPPEARICSIEDTRELNLYHDNWRPSVSRTGFGIPNILGKTYGEITRYELLKETFRQNPDYVILGETRGAETYVLFQGMASGHPSYSTFHAASVESLVRRLGTRPINLSPSLIETLDIICLVSHMKDPKMNIRRVKEIKEVLEVDEKNNVNANLAFQWSPQDDKITFSGSSHIFQKILYRTGTPLEVIEKEFKIRTLLLQKMYDQKIFDFKEFKRIINDYYKEPDSVLKKFKINKEPQEAKKIIARKKTAKK